MRCKFNLANLSHRQKFFFQFRTESLHWREAVQISNVRGKQFSISKCQKNVKRFKNTLRMFETR